MSIVAFTFGGAACANLTEGGSVPSHIADPSTYHTATAARDLANRARTEFQLSVGSVVSVAGLMSDELSAIVTNPYGGQSEGDLPVLDRRVLPEDLTRRTMPGGAAYQRLHKARGYAITAIEALRRYDSTASPALQAELFAIQGYAMIYLADIFCSGVPLSRIEFEKDFVYTPGSSTQELYQHAMDMFDSSVALLPLEDEQIRDWARIGKARALLALGQSDLAATLVTDIDLSYQFNVLIRASGFGSGTASDYWNGVRVADREGMNGFPFVSGGDLRTAVYLDGTGEGSRYLPAKYQTLVTAMTPFTIASGIEAFLIRAEAALDDEDVELWLQLLNAARTSQGMNALDDPVDADERYRLLLNERAAWLFLTGHRQGDLRRTVRNRKVPQEELYPIGSWLGTFISYGLHTNVAIPKEEYANPNFHGCLDRNA